MVSATQVHVTECNRHRTYPIRLRHSRPDGGVHIRPAIAQRLCTSQDGAANANDNRVCSCGKWPGATPCPTNTMHWEIQAGHDVGAWHGSHPSLQSQTSHCWPQIKEPGKCRKLNTCMPHTFPTSLQVAVKDVSSCLGHCGAEAPRYPGCAVLVRATLTQGPCGRPTGRDRRRAWCVVSPRGARREGPSSDVLRVPYSRALLHVQNHRSHGRGHSHAPGHSQSRSLRQRHIAGARSTHVSLVRCVCAVRPRCSTLLPL